MKVSIIPTLVAALSALVAAVPTSSETGNHLDRRITFNDNVFLYPGGLGDPLNSYLGSLPYAKVVNVGWNYYFDKTVPKRCKEKALGKKSDGSVMCPLANLDVWEFFWADAPDLGHVICRCNDSPVTVDKIEQEIGRIPVGMRQHTRNFMFFNNGGGAYAQAGDVTFLGNISPTVVLHETSHTLDGAIQGSSGDTWKNAIASDDCWADYYAKSSYAEAWAQINVLVRYRYGQGVNLIQDLPTALMAPGLSSSCLYLQFWTVVYQTYYEIANGYDAAKIRAKDAIVSKA